MNNKAKKKMHWLSPNRIQKKKKNKKNANKQTWYWFILAFISIERIKTSDHKVILSIFSCYLPGKALVKMPKKKNFQRGKCKRCCVFARPYCCWQHHFLIIPNKNYVCLSKLNREKIGNKKKMWKNSNFSPFSAYFDKFFVLNNLPFRNFFGYLRIRKTCEKNVNRANFEFLLWLR